MRRPDEDKLSGSVQIMLPFAVSLRCFELMSGLWPAGGQFAESDCCSEILALHFRIFFFFMAVRSFSKSSSDG